VELLPRDMKLAGAEGLAGWIRTTWLPFTERLPEQLRGDFIKEVVARYLEKHSLNEEGNVHVGMMRLEVEAYKP